MNKVYSHSDIRKGNKLLICMVLSLIAYSMAQSPLSFEGQASWYGARFAGRPTASGEIFNPDALTAAHPSLPFGTRLKVTNLSTGLSVEVHVNDRGPYHSSRVLDLSQAAAAEIGLMRKGIGKIRAEVVAEDVPVALAEEKPSELAVKPAVSQESSLTLEVADLSAYDVMVKEGEVGELILLRANFPNQSLMVRVVGRLPRSSKVDILASSQVAQKLGSRINIYREP
ncbi:MAG: septal ring lytic transglycosylase RlpA family protein [Deinococcales bacterium]